MFSILLVLSREWMGLGVAGMIITSDYGSFPHFLLSTSKNLVTKGNSELAMAHNQSSMAKGRIEIRSVELLLAARWRLCGLAPSRDYRGPLMGP